MTTRLEVLQAGPWLSIQDSGRPGYARYGLSAGGAMDRYALAEGAALLGSARIGAAIEMAGFGGRFRLLGEGRWVALTGASMKADVDGRPVEWRQCFYLQPDQVLSVSTTTSGAGAGTYGYLHLDGGFNMPALIGAIGAHLRAAVGGVDGGVLREGQLLNLGEVTTENRQPVRLPLPDYFSRRVIRIMWGAHADRFRADTRHRLLNEPIAISLRRDRMAMRLQIDEHAAPFEALLSGLSDPVQVGDIQMTGDGVPAILIREHQPTGGYPRIATVIRADLDLAAQMPSGTKFQFKLVNHDQAIEALKNYQNLINTLGNRVEPIVRAPEQIDNLLEYNLIGGVVRADG